MAKVTRTSEERALAKFIVVKFLPRLPSKRWPQERLMAYKLIKKFPQKKFWETLCPPEKLYTLSWFLRDDLGSYYLNDHVLVFNRQQEESNPKYNFQDKKIGEDFKVDKKSNSALDFFD